ncbi:hypothetical protein [Labilibaculum manganireducens]|uniref:hypothetical protein n=1 Tax=Labilibaculum manganireducens TaxID=1940525 RepID=UPI0015D61FA9|nr:hypothetical protein [Labilibaculum manganireducens]
MNTPWGTPYYWFVVETIISKYVLSHGFFNRYNLYYLEKYSIDADSIAGLIPFSGQTITHFTVRKERGIKTLQPIIDKYAPLFHVRRNAPPILLITGDADKELFGRYEENAYLGRMMKLAGHKRTKLFKLDGFDHGGMAHPAFTLLLKEVDEIVREKK